MKRILIPLVLLGLVFGGVLGWKMYYNQKVQEFLAQQKAPPVYVSATNATQEFWQDSYSSVGSLQAINSVEVTGEVPGLVTSILFDSDQICDKGQILVKLDVRADAAELKKLRAEEELAKIQYDRMQRLTREGNAPQSSFDEARARLRQIRAEILKQQVLIDKKHIKAPFSGVLGLRQVDLGEYLSPGTPLVQLQTLDPIYLNFTLPQKYLGQIAQGQKIAFSVKGWNSQKTFPGKITAIASQVQRQSRNIQIQATLTNPDQILRPGMYGQVLVQRSVKQQHVTLPQTSIEYNPYGDVVYILKPMNATVKDETIYKAIRRFVTTGQTRGDQVSIEKGVQPGDLVVTSGQQKLTEDSSILVNNSIQPQNEPSPQVKDK